MNKKAVLVCLAASFFSPAFSQTSGEQYHAAGIIHGNRVMTSFGNWGVLGEPATLGSRGAWLYPTNGYIGDLSIFVGLELPVRDYNGDGIPDTVHSVITCNVYRPTPALDADPETGKFWTFEPDSGYFNPVSGSPAIRSLPSTWPPVWPDHPEWGSGHWNGLRGPDSLSGDDETYFRMDDRNDARFNFAANNPRGIAFKPDSTDTSRSGAGISVGVRYIQSAQPLFRDIFFRVFDIRNEGTTSYDKVVFGTLNGTYVGITSTEDYMEYANDVSIYFASGEFIRTTNFLDYPSTNPYWHGPVGGFGEAFIQSPTGLHVASFDDIVPPGQVILGNDESLWTRLLPGSYVRPASITHDTVALNGEDCDYMYGSGYFPLKAGETKRVVTCLAYGYTKEEVRQKLLLARALWNSRFDTASVTHSVTLPDFPSHRFVSGTQVLRWTTARQGGTVSIWYSPDAGMNWNAVALGIPNTGSASWNTANFPDAAFGLLRVFASDTSGNVYGMGQTGSYITVSNLLDNTPFVSMQPTGLDTGGVVTQPSVALSILAGEPSWGNLNVSLLYRTSKSGSFVLFDAYLVPSDTLPRSRIVSLKDLPNSQDLQIKVTVQGPGGTSSNFTSPFNKQTPRPAYPGGEMNFTGLAQVPYRISIQDSSHLRPDTYVITFNDTSASDPKKFSVFDRTRGLPVMKDVPFFPRIESAPFDGLTFYSEDTTTCVDTSRTRWNHAHAAGTWAYSVSRFAIFNALPGYAQPYDYAIAFSDHTVDTTTSFDGIPDFPLPAVPAAYRIVNAGTGLKVNQAASDLENNGFTVFLEDVEGVVRPTWVAEFSNIPPAALGLGGDTLFVRTKKGLSYHDTLTVTGLILSIGPERGVPLSYALYQNFPNPFNPSTRIGYLLPVQSAVRLTIYSILGQRVAQLVDGIENAGGHSVEWRGNSDSGVSVSSGVYFCRIEAAAISGGRPAFARTLKMVYLK